MRNWLAAAAVATVVTGTAPAQISVPINTMAFDTSMSVAMNPCSGGRCAARRASPGAARRGLAVAPAAALPASAPLYTGTYQPTEALSQRVSQAFVARLRKKSPDYASQLARELQRVDYRQSYASAVRSDGFRTDSLSDTMAAYAMLGWMIVHNQMHTDRAQATGLRRQFAARVAANPQVLAKRGELAEETKILFVTLYSGMLSAQREGNQRAYSQGVANLMQQKFGLNLTSLDLTPQGFVER